MLKDIIKVIHALIETNRFISAKKMRLWILIPAIICLTVFFYGFFNFGALGIDALQWILHFTGINKWLNTIQDLKLQFFIYIGSVISILMMLLSFLLIFKYLMMIILSPIIAMLYQLHSTQQKNEPLTFNSMIWRKHVLRIWTSILRNLLWQSVYFISLYIISFIPILGWVVPIFTLIMEFYYMGLTMLDLPSEKEKLNISQAAQFIGLHKGLAISTGIITWICSPFYGLILAMKCMHSSTATANE